MLKQVLLEEIICIFNEQDMMWQVWRERPRHYTGVSLKTKKRICSLQAETRGAF